MANRFWVGGTGNWNDTAHWSASSGGASGASVPTSADSVFFDSLSFTASGQTVTLDATANCLDMDWTGVLNNPTLAGNATLNIYGYVYLINMTFSAINSLNLMGSGTKNITTNGVSISKIINFNSASSTWVLQDNLINTSIRVRILAGTLTTNNKNISCSTFDTFGTSTKAINLGSSIITCSTNFDISVTTGLTFDAGTSTIILTGNAASFGGGGLNYNNIEFQGTPTTITGSNTFNTLTIAAGKTVRCTSGTTQTITSLVCNGTTASPSTLQSVTAGSPATIALPAGRYFIRHTSIKDITVTGATVVTSIAGTDVSGNTGITFVTKFEMGRIKNDGSFNWYNTTTGTVTKVSG